MGSLLLVLPIIGLLAIFGLAIRQDKSAKPVDYLSMQDMI